MVGNAARQSWQIWPPGNKESATYRFHQRLVGSNPCLSASLPNCVILPQR